MESEAPMAMLLDETRQIFNLEEVKQRGLIRAQYHSWREARNGIVVAANEMMLEVLFLTQIRTAAQYYRIRAVEVSEGRWTIHYTNDMETFFDIEMTCGVEEDGEIDLSEAETIKGIDGDNSYL